MIRVPEILGRFCVAARPVMLSFLTPSSCIGATRIVCDLLPRYGYSVEAVATKWVVEVPKLKKAYTSGLKPEEYKNNPSVAYGEKGWNGHLVALIDRRWLLDASFDQADHAFGGALRTPKVCQIFTLPHRIDDLEFNLEMAGIFDESKLTARIQYVTMADNSWRFTPAWNDESLSILQYMIEKEMNEVKAL